MRYRKKPIAVEAIRIVRPGRSGSKSQEIRDFLQRHERLRRTLQIVADGWRVTTIDGNRVLVPWGAYCVIDSKGYPYPCDADIFEENHEEAIG